MELLAREERINDAVWTIGMDNLQEDMEYIAHIVRLYVPDNLEFRIGMPLVCNPIFNMLSPYMVDLAVDKDSEEQLKQIFLDKGVL